MAVPSTKPEGPQRRRYAKRLPPADRKEQLLDAALAIITEGGFADVSIAAVAERAGVTRPVVYDSFAGRDDLLHELIERESARMRAAVDRSMAGLESAVPQADQAAVLSAALARFLAEVRAVPASWRLVYFPIDGVPPMLRARLEQSRDDLRTPLSCQLGQWLSGKRGAEDVDVDVLVRVIQGIIHTAAQLVLDDPDRFDIDRIITMLNEMLLRAP
ncbi:TetR/AcrR family transcriptional regulator [Nocardia colli]|uniref:TetR/AcrR family transcriptional regulator n=1 Tax=Nocardia colli TaxID=2545717 RepID=UPI00168CB43A|nr:TetR/AcrR family transcriptional regulator [Nocardia colli]